MVEEFKQWLLTLPNVQVSEDPISSNVVWFDIRAEQLKDNVVVVEARPSGFGISLVTTETGYGMGADVVATSLDLAKKEVEKLLVYTKD